MMKINNEVVISSRVRFARNLKDYPYLSRLDKTCAQEIIEKVGNALGNDYKAAGFASFDSMKALSYMENHKVSREFTEVTLPHELFEKGDIKCMVCEEDHIRLQCIKKGFDLDAAYAEAVAADNELTNKLKIDYDSKLGYLTHCPTNLGSAMRASVMVFLPGLAIKRQLGSIVSQLDKLGFTVRGIYGEGSNAAAYIYQISNRETMGVEEKKLVGSINGIVERIIELENEARAQILSVDKTAFEDKVMRALGIMSYARKMTSKEFMALYADVRLGICCGVIDEISTNELDELFGEVMPATLISSSNEELNEVQRDIKRAQIVRSKIN